MADTNGEPTVSVSMGMKINLGSYESADVFCSVSGLHVGATEAEIDELLDTGRIAYERIREKLKERVSAVRAEGQGKKGWT
jgi:hypothetical protein